MQETSRNVSSSGPVCAEKSCEKKDETRSGNVIELNL